VALRPHGFDRWTWVGGGQDSSGAAWIGTSLGETVDAGVVELPCAPRLRLSWSFGEEERERFDPLLAEARGSFRSQPEERRTRLAAEVEREAVLLTGLPEGEGTVHLRVEHPHFLPQGVVELDVEGRFERGTVRERSLRVPPLGGAIEVLAEAPALRVTQGEQVWIEPAPDGRALLPGLRPGPYAIALCPTVACSRTAGGEHPVTVARGRTTVLDLRR
jgi:hypothetical protein